MVEHPPSTIDAAGAPPASTPRLGSNDHVAPSRQESAADRFMRKILRAERRDQSVSSQQAAHRGFRVSIVVTGIRCLITYVLIPVLAPIISFADVVAAPIGIVLCLVAVISGLSSLRRFWITDHRGKWMYTAFISVVFMIVAIAFVFDMNAILTAI